MSLFRRTLAQLVLNQQVSSLCFISQRFSFTAILAYHCFVFVKRARTFNGVKVGGANADTVLPFMTSFERKMFQFVFFRPQKP